jgi:hypothetical protein
MPQRKVGKGLERGEGVLGNGCGGTVVASRTRAPLTTTQLSPKRDFLFLFLVPFTPYSPSQAYCACWLYL